MIPFIDLSIDNQLSKKVRLEIERVIKSKNFILGPHVKSFEKKFAQYVGVGYAVGVGSGTDALRLAIRALGIGPGDKVLTVALTSPFTLLAIVEEGATPILCDVDYETLTISLEDANRKIDSKTKAIMPVHIYGNPCNMTAILKFARDNNLSVIEDAAQAHGARIEGKKVGSFGLAAAFSFYPTKNLGALGDGGMFVTSEERLYDLVRSLRHGGQSRRFWHKYQGMNSRLDEIQAAILEVKLKNLDDTNKKRQRLAARYQKLLSDLPVQFQKTFTGAKHVYHLFVIMTEKRDSLKKFLEKKGIGCDIYYPYPVYKQQAFAGLGYNDLKATNKAQRRLLALPIYPSLTYKQQDRVIEAVRDFYQ